MSGASWRSAEQVREDRAAAAASAPESGESVFDNHEWAEDDESRAYDRSVAETVKDIEGLGIYVAPAEDAPKEPAKKPPAKK
jgi:hypothetical protein